MDKSVVRQAYVRKVRQPKRTEPEWPHTVVEVGFAMPYSDRFVSGAKIEGYFTIPKDEACPFKYGDLIQVTIKKVPRKLKFADQPCLALGA